MPDGHGFEGLDPVLGERLERISSDVPFWRAQGIDINLLAAQDGVPLVGLASADPDAVEKLRSRYGHDIIVEQAGPFIAMHS